MSAPTDPGAVELKATPLDEAVEQMAANVAEVEETIGREWREGQLKLHSARSELTGLRAVLSQDAEIARMREENAKLRDADLIVKVLSKVSIGKLQIIASRGFPMSSEDRHKLQAAIGEVRET